MSYYDDETMDVKEEVKKDDKRIVLIKLAIIALVVLLISAIACSMLIGNVPTNSTGIRIRAGKMQPEPLSEGWCFKLPIDTIVAMGNERKNTEISVGYGKGDDIDKAAQTKDEQSVPKYKFKVEHQLTPSMSVSVYREYPNGYEENLIVKNFIGITKDVFEQYNSDEFVGKKSIMSKQIKERLNAITSAVGVEIIEVVFLDYDFTQEYSNLLERRAMETAQLKNNEIEQKNARIKAQTEYDVAVKAAEKEAETKRIEAESSRDVKTIEATTAAEVRKIQAQAEAEAAKIEAENEAYVITTKANAEKEARLAGAAATEAEMLAQGSNLTELMVRREIAARWDGKLIPSFGGENGFTFTNMTDVITSYLSGNTHQ